MIKRVAVQSATSTTNKNRSELLRKDTVIGKRTIRWYLSIQSGLKFCKYAQKPKMTERIKSKHLVFAHKYASCSPVQWANVLL